MVIFFNKYDDSRYVIPFFHNVLFVVGNSDYRKTIVTNKNKSIDLNILMKPIFCDKS